MSQLVETHHVRAVAYRDVTVRLGQQQSGAANKWLFLPETSGGSVSIPAASGLPGHHLSWQLQCHTSSTLTLAQISLISGQIGSAVRLQIPEQVFAPVASQVTGSTCAVYLLLSSKTVGVLQLPLQAGQQPTPLFSSSSITDSVQPTSLKAVPLEQQLAPVGFPTAITVTQGFLCVAGSSGSVVCISLQALTAGSVPANAVQTLNLSSFVVQVRRRMGFAANSCVVAALPVDIPSADHQSLLIVHEDSSCHQWHLPQLRQGFSHTLVSDAAARQLRPNRVLLCQNSPAGQQWQLPFDALLIWDMVSADSRGQSDVRVMSFRLQTGPAGTAAASVARKLEPALQQPELLGLEWPDASLLDAKVSGQQLLLLCGAAGGRMFVVSYCCRDWNYQGQCQLLQQQVSQDWGATEELWAHALAAFPGAVSPASQVLGQLLEPSQLCVSSLCQALSYHGAQLTEQEVTAATLPQLQARITAAIELTMAKYPSYGPARCWHTFFATYCECWRQQHAPLALYTAPGGWLGVARAGGLLTVMRRPASVEVLLQESSPAALEQVLQAVGVQGTSGIPGGAAALAKVRICLVTLSDILGPAVMHTMTQLVMAGVSIEGELLPKFVELLLCGPSPAQSPTNSTSTDSSMLPAVQQRLVEWRMQRQARLLAVQEQLAELPHALETLSGVTELVIKVATAASAHLKPPQPAMSAGAADISANRASQVAALLSSIALHTTQASCTVIQQLLLLLGCLKQLGSAGNTHLTAADQAAVATDLTPPLATALRSCAVALWLCKTPASRPIAGVSTGSVAVVDPSELGPLFGLRSPTPSSTPSGTPRKGAGAEHSSVQANGAARAEADTGAKTRRTAGVPIWQLPLSTHLLPLFWRQQGGGLADNLGTQLGSAGDMLAVWLMLGGSAEAAAATAAADTDIWAAAAGFVRTAGGLSARSSPTAAAQAAITDSKGLAGRAVLLGYQLFVCREYEAMRQLVRLVAGNHPSEAGLQFILGLSIACGIKKGQGASSSLGTSESDAQARQLDAAVGHLFRAAAGLCNDDSAPLRLVLKLLRKCQGSSGTKPQQRDAAHGEAIGKDMQQTEEQAAAPPYGQAGDQGPSGEIQQEAKLKLEFCQAVMLLFEREEVIEGALAFARAAIGATEAACHHQQLKTQQQAALWSRVLTFATELGQYQDAYTAALSNPDPERAAEGIRRLVQILVDHPDLKALLSLPWAGVLVLNRQGVREPVPVVELVVDKLTRRALHSDLSARPNAYHVLFDFVVAWSSYKHAAATMLSYARRLRAAAAGGGGGALAGQQQQQLSQVVTEVCAAYGACIAMLQLLPPADAWLDPDEPLLAPYPASPPHSSTGSSSGKPWQQQQLQWTSSAAAADDPLPEAAVNTDLAVLSLAGVQHEAALFSAAALLVDYLPGLHIMQYGLAADYVFEQLVGTRQTPAALELAHAMWDGQQLSVKLDAVVFAAAQQCVKQQISNDADQSGTRNGSTTGLNEAILSYTGPGYLGSAAAASWQKLRQLLEHYDSVEHSSSTTTSSSSSNNSNGAVVAAANGDASASSRAADSNGSSISVVGGQLRLAAVDGALAVQAGVHLPPWLTEPFNPLAGNAGSMAGTGADPAGLLRVYLKHGRLVDAAKLVRGYLESWQMQGPLLRGQAAAVWIPLQEIELLHASLVAGAQRASSRQLINEAEVLGLWSEILEACLQDHVTLVRSDNDKLGAVVPSGGRGLIGPVGMVF